MSIADIIPTAPWGDPLNSRPQIVVTDDDLDALYSKTILELNKYKGTNNQVPLAKAIGDLYFAAQSLLKG